MKQVKKFHVKGRRVMCGKVICRVKKSRKAANRCVNHLNDLHTRKLKRGCFTPPLNSWSAWPIAA